MFNDLSVTKKGLAAFVALALVGVAAGLVLLRPRPRRRRRDRAGEGSAELTNDARTAQSAVLGQAFAIQSFILSGDRDRLVEYETAMIQTRDVLVEMKAEAQAVAPTLAADVAAAEAVLAGRGAMATSRRKSSACAIRSPGDLARSVAARSRRPGFRYCDRDWYRPPSKKPRRDPCWSSSPRSVSLSPRWERTGAGPRRCSARSARPSRTSTSRRSPGLWPASPTQTQR